MTKTTKEQQTIATEIDERVIEEALASVERSEEREQRAGEEPSEDGGEEPSKGSAEAHAEQPGETTELQEELERVQAQLIDARTQLESERAKVLRGLADLENIRKRAAREREEMRKFGQESLLSSFLPVIDNLDRAIGHAVAAGQNDSFLEGIRMTRKLFEDTLAKAGVIGFDSLGKIFDPTLHEAMQTVESDEPEQTIVGEMLRGYLLNDRLMRAALVTVSKGQSAKAPATKVPEAPPGGPKEVQ